MFLLQTSVHSFTTIYDKVIPKNIMNEFIDIKSAVQEFKSQCAWFFTALHRILQKLSLSHNCSNRESIIMQDEFYNQACQEKEG